LVTIVDDEALLHFTTTLGARLRHIGRLLRHHDLLQIWLGMPMQAIGSRKGAKAQKIRWEEWLAM
jgi:hypothetical protein